MNSITTFTSSIRNAGLAAFAATAAFAAMGLVTPARAASDYLLELDGVKGETAVIEKDLCDKSKEAQALIDSITADIQALQALGPEFASLGDQLLKVRKQGEDQKEYFAAQIEDAQKIFDEQVASLLDASIAEQVSKDLDARRQSALSDVAPQPELEMDDLSQLQELIDSMSDEVGNLAKISAITARFGKCVATDSGDYKY